MLNQEIKEKTHIKMDKEFEQLQALQTLGIVWLCLGATNPLFFILGLVFIISSVAKSKRIKNISIDGGIG
ncbi:MAG: hypothetical protein ACFFB5_22770 [Promethearchaeota archaeon]